MFLQLRLPELKSYAYNQHHINFGAHICAVHVQLIDYCPRLTNRNYTLHNVTRLTVVLLLVREYYCWYVTTTPWYVSTIAGTLLLVREYYC